MNIGISILVVIVSLIITSATTANDATYPLACSSDEDGGSDSRAAVRGKLVLKEDFSQGMERWWVEGGEKVWVEDERLHVRANPPERQPGYVATVWLRQSLPANLRVEFDVRVLASAVQVNNINLFCCYAHPTGTTLYATRADRADGAYNKYHDLNGYIVTFLNDASKAGGAYDDGTTKARLRMRRCPGFNLVDEDYTYHCRANQTYHVEFTKRNGQLTYCVNGRAPYLKWTDPDPLPGGLLGFRTFRTYLWWDNLKVWALEVE